MADKEQYNKTAKPYAAGFAVCSPGPYLNKFKVSDQQRSMITASAFINYLYQYDIFYRITEQNTIIRNDSMYIDMNLILL